MEIEKITFKSLGHDLAGIVEYPSGTPAPGVVLCHGLSNTKEDCPLIEETAGMLVNEGFVTFRFDYFGSGESPGTMMDKTISQLHQNTRDAIDFFLSNESVTDVGMWGRSFGGTLVGLCASSPGVRASVVASGVFYLKKVFDKKELEEVFRKGEKMEKDGRRLPGTGHYKGKYGLGERWYVECEEYEDKLLTSLRQMSNVLVLGTSPDQKVPSENSVAIYDAVGDPKEIHIFGNTDHAYEGAESEALSLVKRWFDINLGW